MGHYPKPNQDASLPAFPSFIAMACPNVNEVEVMRSVGVHQQGCQGGVYRRHLSRDCVPPLPESSDVESDDKGEETEAGDRDASKAADS